MKEKITIAALVTVFTAFNLFVAFSPQMASAVNCGGGSAGSGGTYGSGTVGGSYGGVSGSVSGSASSGSGSNLVYDPATGLCVPQQPGQPQTVNDLILRIINIILMVAAVIAILFIVIGGFRYITSNGNEEQAGKGRSTLVNAIIGLIIIILAYTIVRVVVNTATQVRQQ